MNEKKDTKYLGKFKCVKDYIPFKMSPVGSMFSGNYYHLYSCKSEINTDAFSGDIDIVKVFDEDDEQWIFSSAKSSNIIEIYLISIEENRKNKIDSILDEQSKKT